MNHRSTLTKKQALELDRRKKTISVSSYRVDSHKRRAPLGKVSQMRANHLTNEFAHAYVELLSRKGVIEADRKQLIKLIRFLHEVDGLDMKAITKEAIPSQMKLRLVG